MLDKDCNKRLGSSKSTMFNIGGVGALKLHPFFGSLNWDKLLRMELVPPIDITAGRPFLFHFLHLMFFSKYDSFDVPSIDRR